MENIIVMNRMKQILCCLAIAVFFSTPAVVSAQADVDGLIASGTAKSEAMANRMRVTWTIKATGSDMEQAIKILKTRQEKAKTKMGELEVIEDSIKFDPISSGSGDARQSQIIEAMMSQAQNDKRIEKMMKHRPSFVQVSVSADWKLNADLDEVEMLISADKLKRKIAAVDVNSAKEKDKLSAAQEEMVEEMAEMASNYGNEPDSTTPDFSYVRALPTDDVDKLVSDAVAKAKKNGQRLAKNAGVELGAIFRVTEPVDAQPPESYYDPYGGYQTKASSEPETDEDGTIYVVSDSPRVTVSREVSVAFKIEAK